MLSDFVDFSLKKMAQGIYILYLGWPTFLLFALYFSGPSQWLSHLVFTVACTMPHRHGMVVIKARALGSKALPVVEIPAK